MLTLARDVGSGYGGAEKVAFEFVRRLDEQRFKSYLCTTRAPHHTRVESVARDRRELDEGLDRGTLTLRGFDRCLRVAWTLADLAGAARPGRAEVMNALTLREIQEVKVA